MYVATKVLVRLKNVDNGKMSVKLPCCKLANAESAPRRLGCPSVVMSSLKSSSDPMLGCYCLSFGAPKLLSAHFPARHTVNNASM